MSSAIRPRATGPALDIQFDPAETAVLSAGQSASVTAWVRGLATGPAQATIDAVRVRDGAGTSHILLADFAGGPVQGDLDGDGDVDAADLATLLNSWGACKACAADFDGNGSVDAADIAVLLNAWG
jgi:hypothetical protein